jgi:hypothetical protein
MKEAAFEIPIARCRNETTMGQQRKAVNESDQPHFGVAGIGTQASLC